MEPMYIVFACAGGVFILLLIAYLLVSIESWKKKNKMRRDILKVYGDSEHLSKVEYDFAFYDNALHGGDLRKHSAKQVTIDDFVGGNEDNEEKTDDLSRFRPIYEVKENVIVGHYDPESISK